MDSFSQKNDEKKQRSTARWSGSVFVGWFIELDDGKIYRKPLYLMVKTMVSCRFSLKPIHWLMAIYMSSDLCIHNFAAGVTQQKLLMAPIRCLSGLWGYVERQPSGKIWIKQRLEKQRSCAICSQPYELLIGYQEGIFKRNPTQSPTDLTKDIFRWSNVAMMIFPLKPPCF